MAHIEVSRKIELGKKVDTADIKNALVERLEKILEIENISDGLEVFKVIGTTGSDTSLTRHARISIDIEIECEAKLARVMISGRSEVAKSLISFYGFALIVILLVGLLPGSVNTGVDGGAMDALVFLLVGFFMVYDMSRKLEEPANVLSSILETLDTQFG